MNRFKYSFIRYKIMVTRGKMARAIELTSGEMKAAILIVIITLLTTLIFKLS